MRHSSLKLTGRYTKPRAVDIESDASVLPNLKPSPDQPEAVVMTGTNPAPVLQPTATEIATQANTCASKFQPYYPYVVPMVKTGLVSRAKVWRLLLIIIIIEAPIDRSRGELGR
jgi:hypothetical protein